MSASKPPPDDLDADQRLLWAVRGGDREAFRLLYDRLGAPVMHFLYGLCQDRATAEDLVQETFLAVWKAAPRWTPRGKVSTWIFQIAKRRWWKRAARRRMRREREARAARPLGSGVSPDAARAEHADEVARLRKAILGLSPRLRAAFVLIRLEDQSYAETARILGIRTGTVKSRMAAAEAHLRRTLDEEPPRS